MNKRAALSLLLIISILGISLSHACAATKPSVKKANPKAATTVKKAPAKPVEWAAKVNGEMITMDWYNRVLDASKKAITMEMSLEAAEEKGIVRDTKKRVLEQMIESLVLIQWADREGIEVSQNSINYSIKQLKKGFSSVSDFYASLKEQGMSQADLERDIRKQIIIGKLIETRAKNMAVSDEEMLAFYNKNIELYAQNEKLHLSQEYFKNSAEADAEISALMEKKEFQGEDIGLIEKGQLPVYDDSPVFMLDAGRTSGVISGEAGYYIFKVEEKIPAREITYADAKDSIRKFLLKEKARLQYMKDLQAEKAGAKIILNEKLGQLF